MKKKYEKNQLVFSLTFVIIIIYFVFISYLCTYKFTKYILINGKVSGNDLIDVVIDNYDLKYLKANKYVYINDKKKKREILEVNRNMVRTKDKYYHIVKLKIKLNNDYKEEDNIVLRVVEKHDKLYKIFLSCWKENNNEKD